MKTRAALVADFLKALRGMEITPSLLRSARLGVIESDDLVQFFRDTLGAAVQDLYDGFAERAGGVTSIRQLISAEGGLLFADLAASSFDQVQAVLTRAKDTWSDEKLTRELSRAVRMNSKDAEAAKKYDAELKSGDSTARRRRLRDRRFSQKGDVSLAKRKLMVGRYQERLASHRMASMARDWGYSAQAATDFTHWTDRASAGDPEAVGARKFWDNMDDQKVRDSHVYVVQDYPDGLPLDVPFVTRWGFMRYPHDSQGHAKDRHGCRCKFRIKRATT